MFYCNPCADKNDYPQSMSKSNGKCELCNKNALCNDVHHSKLPSVEPMSMIEEISEIVEILDKIDIDMVTANSIRDEHKVIYTDTIVRISSIKEKLDKLALNIYN